MINCILIVITIYLTFALSWIGNKPPQALMLEVAGGQEFKSLSQLFT